MSVAREWDQKRQKNGSRGLLKGILGSTLPSHVMRQKARRRNDLRSPMRCFDLCTAQQQQARQARQQQPRGGGPRRAGPAGIEVGVVVGGGPEDVFVWNGEDGPPPDFVGGGAACPILAPSCVISWSKSNKAPILTTTIQINQCHRVLVYHQV